MRQQAPLGIQLQSYAPRGSLRAVAAFFSYDSGGYDLESRKKRNQFALTMRICL